MKREELKKVLLEAGVDSRLLEMPAVLERIYNTRTVQRKYGDEHTDVKVNEDGSFDTQLLTIYGGATEFAHVEIKEDGKATIRMRDTIIDIDEYGMDYRYKDSEQDVLRLPKAQIMNYFYEEQSMVHYIDDGDWNATKQGKLEYIKNQKQMQLEWTDEDIESILKQFEENQAFIIEHYPNTEPWFTKRREELGEILGITIEQSEGEIPLEEMSLEQLEEEKQKIEQKTNQNAQEIDYLTETYTTKVQNNDERRIKLIQEIQNKRKLLEAQEKEIDELKSRIDKEERESQNEKQSKDAGETEISD